MAFSPPEPLAAHHDLGDFACGVAVLDDWLKRRAKSNQASGATRTFVIGEEGRVAAYYSIAAGSIESAATTGRFRRNMPDPIPVVVLARLAVDQGSAGRGLGKAMVRDCARRVLHAAETIGVRGLLVHAISEDAKAFYQAQGFDVSPVQPLTLMIPLMDLRAAQSAA